MSSATWGLERGDEWIDAVALLDADELDRVNAAALNRFASAEHALIDRVLAALEVAQSNSFLRDGATSLGAWLRNRLGVDEAEAHRLTRQVGVLGRMPSMVQAIESGTVPLSALTELSRYATGHRLEWLAEFDEQLTEHAANRTAREFRQICAHWADHADNQRLDEPDARNDRWLTLTPTLFGEADVRGHLTADQASVVGAALDALDSPDPESAPIQRTVAERRADALAELAHHFLNQPPSTKSLSPARPRRAKATGIVAIDLDSFAGHRRHSDADRETTIDLASIRRELMGVGPIRTSTAELLLCDAEVKRLILDQAGQPLNTGRPTPTVSAAQRQALHVRDGGCVFPTCDRPAHWTDAHHLHHRSRGGPTDIDNLVLLCRFHHRLIHGPDWDLERHPDTGRVRAIRSDGTIYQSDPPNDGVITYFDPRRRPLRDIDHWRPDPEVALTHWP